MRTLAIDTALAAVQAAVREGDTVLAQASEPMARGHQERLAPLVAETLARAGAPPSAVERVAVTTGPGSFTGLRVGLAFAKAFALARGVPCSGVGTLAALAASCPHGDVVACIAAPQGRAYVQRFSGGRPEGPPLLLATADAVTMAQGAHLVGPGAAMLGGAAAPGALVLEHPDIALVARLGAERLAPPDPVYLREVGALTLAERRAAGTIP